MLLQQSPPAIASLASPENYLATSLHENISLLIAPQMQHSAIIFIFYFKGKEK